MGGIGLAARHISASLTKPFVIARGARHDMDLVQLELRYRGLSGFGEAAPIARYEESIDSVLDWLELIDLGDDPFATDRVWAGLPLGQQAARAAVDAALHDLQGKMTGLAVSRLLGLQRHPPPTSWTVSLCDPETMARDAESAARRGFKWLKLKLGGRDGEDLERVRHVRAVTDLPIQVDVNEAWTIDEALHVLDQADIQCCEQPLRAGDPEGPSLKRRSRVPIFVDEDCRSLHDLVACAERAHGVNLKLAKTGGIREALRMVAAARALGLGLMIGCMIETSLGIAAGAQIANLFDLVNLDGHLLLADDPWTGLALTDGVVRPSVKPGLGVCPSASIRGVSDT